MIFCYDVAVNAALEAAIAAARACERKIVEVLRERFPDHGFLGGCVWSVTVALMTRTGRRRRVRARRGIEMVGRSVRLSDQREAA